MNARALQRLSVTALVAAVFLLPAPPTAAQSATPVPVESAHGADALFVSADLAIIWAVLKDGGASSDKATVWLRIINRTGAFSHLTIDGVDPFTSTRKRLESGLRLTKEVRLSADREQFANLTSRELHFYRTESDWRADRPALNVYYLGVPDTTPEFTSRTAMDAYLEGAKLVAHPVQKKP